MCQWPKEKGQKKKQWWPLSNEPIKKFNFSSSLFNIQLLPSYEMNIETCQPKGGCFPEGFSPWERKKENNFSRVDNLMFISYESKHCFLYRNYSKMFNNFNILFCRWQQHNFRDSKTLRNRIGINKENFNTFSVVRGCAPSDNLLSSSIL